MRRGVLALLLAPSIALASAEHPSGPHPPLTLGWMVAQLVPSPGFTFGDGRARWDVRWQATPLLWSFGMHRKLSPWRAFVVEPLTRTSGSLEIYVAPELADLGPRPEDLFILRAGARVTLPLVERGDYLAIAFGSGPWIHAGEVGAHWEWGLTTLFGMLGIDFSVAPRLRGAEYLLSLRVRVF